MKFLLVAVLFITLSQILMYCYIELLSDIVHETFSDNTRKDIFPISFGMVLAQCVLVYR